MKQASRTTIEVNGKSYLVKFGMGALMHFSEPFGGDVEKTMQQLQVGGFQQMKAIGKFIYSALYVDSLYKEIELDLTLSDILDWLDTSPIGQLQEISEVMAAGITAISEVKTPNVKSFEGSKKK
jgi:hypothetical protein